jgi:hypothetical protein
MFDIFEVNNDEQYQLDLEEPLAFSINKARDGDISLDSGSFLSSQFGARSSHQSSKGGQGTFCSRLRQCCPHLSSFFMSELDIDIGEGGDFDLLQDNSLGNLNNGMILEEENLNLEPMPLDSKSIGSTQNVLNTSGSATFEATPEKKRKKTSRKKRKRKATLDTVIELSNAQIRAQLEDVSDITSNPAKRYKDMSAKKSTKICFKTHWMKGLGPDLQEFHQSFCVGKKAAPSKEKKESKKDDQQSSEIQEELPFDDFEIPEPPGSIGLQHGRNSLQSESDVEFARGSYGGSVSADPSYKSRKSNNSFLGLKFSEGNGSDADNSRLSFDEDFDLPHSDIPISQFSIPEEIGQGQHASDNNKHFTKISRVFVRILSGEFSKPESKDGIKFSELLGNCSTKLYDM